MKRIGVDFSKGKCKEKENKRKREGNLSDGGDDGGREVWVETDKREIPI